MKKIEGIIKPFEVVVPDARATAADAGDGTAFVSPLHDAVRSSTSFEAADAGRIPPAPRHADILIGTPLTIPWRPGPPPLRETWPSSGTHFNRWPDQLPPSLPGYRSRREVVVSGARARSN